MGHLPLPLVEAGDDVIRDRILAVREGEVDISVAHAAVGQDVLEGEIEEETRVDCGIRSNRSVLGEIEGGDVEFLDVAAWAFEVEA